MEMDEKIKIAVSHFRQMIQEMSEGDDINVGQFLDSVSIATAMMIYSSCQDKSRINNRVNDFTKNFNGLVRSTVQTLLDNRSKSN